MLGLAGRGSDAREIIAARHTRVNAFLLELVGLTMLLLLHHKASVHLEINRQNSFVSWKARMIPLDNLDQYGWGREVSRNAGKVRGWLLEYGTQLTNRGPREAEYSLIF